VKPRLFAAVFGIAILHISVSSPVVAQHALAAAQQVTLTSQIALRIRQTPQGSLSTAAYAQRLGDAIRAVIAGHARTEAIRALAQINPSDFPNPAAVAAAIGQIKAQLSATAAMAGHLPHSEFHPPIPGATAAAPLPLPPPPPPPVPAPQTDVAAPLPAPVQPAPVIVPPAPSGQTSAPPPASSQKLDVKYNAPNTVPLGKPTDFRLIIASAHVVGANDFSGAPGTVAGRQIPKVSQVKAVMSGPKDAVDISSGSAPCQTVSASDNPAWDWAVTPKATGSFQLQVDIWEVGPDCNAPAPVVHRIDNFSIKVTATWWQTLTNGLSAFNTFLTAFFALVAAGGAAFGAWKWLRPSAKD